MEMAAIMNRTFHFVGNFVPVKWKCRVMLPSGKLCERMDRVKVWKVCVLVLPCVSDTKSSILW